MSLAKSAEIVDVMAPFMLTGQEPLSPLQEIIQKGLIYDLTLRLTRGCEADTDENPTPTKILRPLISAIESVRKLFYIKYDIFIGLYDIF